MSQPKMNRRSFVTTLAVGASASLLPMPSLATVFSDHKKSSARKSRQKPSLKKKHPNVLIILTDQQTTWTLGRGYDDMLRNHNQLGNADYEHLDLFQDASPYLTQKFMKGSHVFLNHFCNSQVCTPSRAALFTGTYPHKNGAIQNKVPLNGTHKTLMKIYQYIGYKTAYLRKWHLNVPDSPELLHAFDAQTLGINYYRYFFNQGHWKNIHLDQYEELIFDKFPQKWEEYTTNVLFDEAGSWIKRMKQNNPTSPWCAVVSIPDPHSPFRIHEQAEHFNPNDMPTIENEYEAFPGKMETGDVQVDKARYLDMSRLIDIQFKQLIKQLKKMRELKNTVIIFTSDHGMLWQEHQRMFKGCFFDRAARVPLVIRPSQKHRFSRKWRRPHVINQVTSHVDILSTLFELTNVTHKVPEEDRKHMQGNSFTKLLEQGDACQT